MIVSAFLEIQRVAAVNDEARVCDSKQCPILECENEGI